MNMINCSLALSILLTGALSATDPAPKAFIDGHGKTFKVKPMQDYWRDTGGHMQLRPGFGLPAYTYPPNLNVEGKVPEAEWWVPPTYPDGPIHRTCC